MVGPLPEIGVLAPFFSWVGMRFGLAQSDSGRDRRLSATLADLKQVKSLRLTDRSCFPGSFHSMSFSPDGSQLALVFRMLQDNPGCQTLKD